MCGIVGYAGSRSAVPILIQGLEHLEYRGYDSAGIACLTKDGQIGAAKEKGKLAALKDSLSRRSLQSSMGIGHTRWATHGEPSKANAHPHLDALNRLAVVHNGIIENHAEIRKELQAKGIRFRSETDTEVIVHLISYYARRSGLLEAFRKAAKRLRGHFCFVLLSEEIPDELLAFRRSNPLCIGLGRGENFIASDVTPLLRHTQKVIYLEDEEYVRVRKKRVQIFSLKTGREVKRRPSLIRWNLEQARKGGYRHYMLKEIYEQPEVLKEILAERTGPRGIWFDTLDAGALRRIGNIKRAFFAGCGTAYHAGLIGKLLFEEILRLPSAAQVASEFRYCDPVITRKDLVVLITQSGETADTLAALREARRKGAMTLAIVNVVGSTIAREADAVIYTHAGPEIGVASTKAYTAQLFTLALLAVYAAKLRKSRSPGSLRQMILEMTKLPEACRQMLRQARKIDSCARLHYKRRQYLYLGRGYNFPTALEGALKLKEITYSHAHGYAAGEMKHGPIALIDSRQAVLCIAPASKTYAKMLSNIEEIRARKGIVIAIGTDGDEILKKRADTFIGVPRVPEYLSPIAAVLPLQLFAYKVAVLKGRHVDQPRNLAKSVTVE